MQYSSKYIPEFEGVRGLMAWWVVFGHVANYSGIFYQRNLAIWFKPIVLTNIPVEIFMALSGFAISSLLAKPQIGYGHFMLGRAFRMYPVYLVSLLISLFFFNSLEISNLAGFWRTTAENLEVTQYFASIRAHFWEHVGLHLSLLHGMVPDQILRHSGSAFIGLAWSLSLEWQFYLLAPLLFFVATKHFYIFIVMSMGMLALKWLLLSFNLTFSYGAFLPVNYGFFLLGIALYLYLQNRINHAVITFLMALSSLALSDNIYGSILSFCLWIGFSTLFISTLGERYWPTRWLKSLFTTRLSSYLGKISFSTYLIHFVAIDSVGYVVAHIATPSWSKTDIFFTMLIPVVIITLAASALLHHWVEAPGMRMGKKLSTPPKLGPATS